MINDEEHRLLYNEDGSDENVHITTRMGNGSTLDENGDVIDPMEPAVATILDLMETPELTHKGEWIVWLLGVNICNMTAISILFADELLRWKWSFRVQNVGQVEPSDLVIVCWYIGWTISPFAALGIFVMGLR